jgi:hypothetical protein
MAGASRARLGSSHRTSVACSPTRIPERYRRREHYRSTCESLVERHRRGSLPPEWAAEEHGGECRFENERTGQVVEAPLREGAEAGRVDPYFFAIFVRTTPGHERVAELIQEDFHDAARMLDLVEPTAAGDAEAPGPEFA